MRYVHGGRIVNGRPYFEQFVEALRQALGERHLGRLHEDRQYERFAVGAEYKTLWHGRYYGGGFTTHVEPLYQKFLREHLRPLLGESFVYQRIPTLRVHLPGNVGVGEFHADGKYGHPGTELNVMLPVTACRETAAMWIESEVGRRDYRPANLDYGELFLFHGAVLQHGNLPNETGLTRVSLDFRIIPERLYQPSEAVTHNSRLKFERGGYYAAEVIL